MTYIGLAQAIRAEVTRTDITVATMAQRLRKSRDDTAKIMHSLVSAGLIETKAHAYNNLHYYRVTDAGYDIAAVTRPQVMG